MGLIKKILGAPEKMISNPHYPHPNLDRRKIKLFSKERVLRIERMDQVKKLLEERKIKRIVNKVSKRIIKSL